ncbi:MAG: hypothetical protein NPINA01_19940 [Nitrospinaceae bacterium]|nr:MAG: hypothetical protein NPINA01_19940 [Nitrospinaceae bacterium]
MNYQRKMKKAFLTLVFIASILSCAKDNEGPLIMPVGAEPSAKLHNDSGISHYQSKRYQDALLQFMQAYAADKTTGEIHFNIALAYHKRGNSKKAEEHFKLARKYANGNNMILESQLLAVTLNREKQGGG